MTSLWSNLGVCLCLLLLWANVAYGGKGGILKLTSVDNGLRADCKANMLLGLCTLPELGGTQACVEPGRRVIEGGWAGNQIEVRSFYLDFSARFRDLDNQLSDIATREIQEEYVQQLKERTTDVFYDTEYGNSGLIGALLGTTSVESVSFTKYPDTSSTYFLEAASHWMNTVPLQGPENCTRLPLVLAQFTLPLNYYNNLDHILVNVEGVVTGYHLRFDASESIDVIEQIRIGVNCLSYHYVDEAGTPTSTPTYLNNANRFKEGYGGLRHCLDP